MERFWSQVEKLANGCWHFSGSPGGRSGLFIYRAGNMAAHRVAYRLQTGRALTSTEFLKPMCEDPKCIAPWHNQVVPRHLLQTPSRQHTARSLEVHPAYQGVLSAQEVVRFLSQPGAMAWATKTGRLYVWWNDHQYEGETLEEAVRAAKEAA